MNPSHIFTLTNYTIYTESAQKKKKGKILSSLLMHKLYQRMCCTFTKIIFPPKLNDKDVSLTDLKK